MPAIVAWRSQARWRGPVRQAENARHLRSFRFRTAHCGRSRSENAAGLLQVADSPPTLFGGAWKFGFSADRGRRRRSPAFPCPDRDSAPARPARLHANEVVSSERLIDELWPGDPPESAASALQAGIVAAPQGARRPRRADRHSRPRLRHPSRPDQLDVRPLRAARRGRSRCRSGVAAETLRSALPSGAAPARRSRLRVVRAGADPPLRSCASWHSNNGSTLTSPLGGTPSSSRSSKRSSPSIRSERRFGRRSCSRSTGRPPGGSSGAVPGRRRTLVDELGIEPSPALQELEKSILQQDSRSTSPDRRSLDAPSGRRARGGRLEPLLPVAEPLAKKPPRELILARLLDDRAALTSPQPP